MIHAERVRDLMKAMRVSQSELARRVGVTQATIEKIANGRVAGSSHLHKVARELGTTPAFLTGETDDPAAGALPAPTPASVAEQLDAQLVPLYPRDFGMGDGQLLDNEQISQHLSFPKAFLRERMRGTPADAILIVGRGDSMEPTIADGDVCGVDTSDTVVDDPDQIWAFTYADAGYIKRLRKLPKGGFVVTSDNKVVPSFNAAADEVRIVGRVFSILKWK